MKPTLEFLTKMIESERNEQQRIIFAIELNICPECGSRNIKKKFWSALSISRYVDFKCNDCSYNTTKRV
jgi:hypothetical protein